VKQCAAGRNNTWKIEDIERQSHEAIRRKLLRYAATCTNGVCDRNSARRDEEPIANMAKSVSNCLDGKGGSGSTALCWDLTVFFQFLNPLHGRYNSLDGGSARRNTVTCTQDNTRKERTQIERESSQRPPHWNVRKQFMLQTGWPL
jgi:hypothetical protein